MMNKDKRKAALLTAWAEAMVQVAAKGLVTNSKPITLYGIRTICGPRAGVLEISAGLDAGKLLRALSADTYAVGRQFIPPGWDFIGEPAVFMSGRYVRMEAGWPDDLAEREIRLSDLGANPKDFNPRNPTRWIVGKNELGITVTLSLTDRIPHLLAGGTSGSGKTWAMRSALTQLATREGINAPLLVLIDAKWGDGFRPLANLPHQIAPMAVNHAQADAALAWTLTEMRRRYVTRPSMTEQDWEDLPPLVVAIDEIQELTGRGQERMTQMIRQIAAQGRAAKIHLMVGTQHPVMDAFGDPQTKRNLQARMAFHTDDAISSQVIIGAPEPRANNLLGAGDAYVVAQGKVLRTQVAYLTAEEIEQVSKPDFLYPEWPESVTEDISQDLTDRTRFTGQEVALSLVNAERGHGRPRLGQLFESVGLREPGVPKARALMQYGKDILEELRKLGYSICEVD